MKTVLGTIIVCGSTVLGVTAVAWLAHCHRRLATSSERLAILALAAEWLARERQADPKIVAEALDQRRWDHPSLTQVQRIEAAYRKISPTQVERSVAVGVMDGSRLHIASISAPMPWEDAAAEVRAGFIRGEGPEIRFVILERQTQGAGA
jgi:hypothetical protein